MEIADSAKNQKVVLLYEAVGTMLFVYCILLTNNAISIAFSLFASIILFGAITGGHFNPAVTLGVYISEGKWSENGIWLVSIVICQFIGSFVAQILADLTLYEGTVDNVPAEEVAKLCPQDPSNDNWPTVSACDGYVNTGDGFHSDWQVIVNETILTAVFVGVILMVKGARTRPSGDGLAGALSIVLTLLACIQTGGKLGGCFNPAVGLSVGTYALMHLEDINNSLGHYIYAFVIGPALGGAIAGTFHLFHRENFEEPLKMQERSSKHSMRSTERLIPESV